MPSDGGALVITSAEGQYHRGKKHFPIRRQPEYAPISKPMSDEEILEFTRWLLTQKISGATRDFLENVLFLGSIGDDPQDPDQRRMRELILLYPR
jgi:hypothetical protein